MHACFPLSTTTALTYHQLLAFLVALVALHRGLGYHWLEEGNLSIVQTVDLSVRR